VAALVVGDMLGTGVFFTPGELASLAESPWQVYFLWGLCGTITLCGALTLAELSTLLPRSGATYHIIREGFGPFWAFVKIWVELWVSGPGSVAGVAIVFGEFAARFASGSSPSVSATSWGAAAILVFMVVNLLGIQWGGRTQVVLTALKLAGLLSLVLGSLLLASPAGSAAPGPPAAEDASLAGFVRLVGLGVAAVLFTYDGWIDVSHVAGEVKEPQKHLPSGLGLGVLGITTLYLIVNHAFLRVVPLEAMRRAPTTVASTVALAVFGPRGAQLVSALILISILGALGGLVMTLPRLYYAVAAQYVETTTGRFGHSFFWALSSVSTRSVPTGSVVFSAAIAILALLFFGGFRRIVSYFVVPLHLVNILMVASVFRLRHRAAASGSAYLTPGYPWVPAVYVLVLVLFLVSAIVYNPRDTLIGVVMTATAVPVYLGISRRAA
jgi:APA family basic amino acid/polyamine antiporter